MACSHLAPNGEKSLLYTSLEEKFGEQRAHDIWTAARTEQFTNAHPWESLDANGEPEASWVLSKLDIAEPTPAQREEVKVSLEPEKPVSTRESEDVMIGKVGDIYKQATENPDKIYKVDYEFKGRWQKNNSKYSMEELANFFDAHPIPANVKFNESFQKFIQNSSKRIIQEFASNVPIELMNRDEHAIQESVAKILIPKVGQDGRSEGYFTPLQQQEITDSLVFATQRALMQNPNAKANALVQSMYAFSEKAKALPDGELKSNLQYVYQQRVRIADGVMRQMEGLGLHIDSKSRAKVLKAIELLKPMSEQEKKAFEETHPEVNLAELDQSTGEFVESMGRGLKDWNDVVFELDPKDTASSRIKMFIATLPETDRGVFKVEDGTGSIHIDPTQIMVKGESFDAMLKKHSKDAFNEWKKNDPIGLQKFVNEVNRKSFWMKDEKTSKAAMEFMQSNYSLLPRSNFLGLRKLVDFESTFQDVLETLADHPQKDFQSYINTLIESNNPNLQYLTQELLRADKQMQNEFSKVVNKQYQNFTMVLFNRTANSDGTDSFKLNPINANRYNQKNTLIKSWQEQQKLSDLIIVNKAGERVIDVTRAQERWIPNLKHFQAVNDWSPEMKNLPLAKKFMGDMFRVSGIDMTPEMMDYLFANMEKLTKGKSFSGGIAKQFSITADGKPAGMFSAFIMKTAGMSDIADVNENTDVSAKRAELNNPLYTENSTMQVLANVAAKFTPVLHSSNHKSSDGKNVWDYGLNTKLSYKMLDMLNNFDDFKAVYDQVDVAKDNWLLSAINENRAHLSTMKLAYLDGVKPTWGKRGTTRKSMSDREQLLTSIALFQNQGNGFNKIPKVNYLSLTHSDKTTTPVFMSMPKLNVGRDGVMPKSIIGDIGSAMYNVFRSEHQRIVNQRNQDFNDARYNAGKNLFYFIPEFNYDAMKKMVKDDGLSEKEFRMLWVNGERNLTQSITNDRELPVINKVLTLVSDRMTESTLNKWRESGIISDNENMFDKKYEQKLMYENGIKLNKASGKQTSFDLTGTGTEAEAFADTYVREGKIIPKEDVQAIIQRTAAKDYTLNHFLFNVASSQIFYGDPALTFKGKKGAHDLANVSTTMKEYSKRLAKDIAPGQDPYWEADDKTYNTITLADVNVREEYLSKIKALNSAYDKVNATDAQEFTTVKEHLKLQNAMGLIPVKTFNEMMKIVEDAKGDYYEFTVPEHLAVILQPTKPVYSGNRAPDRGALLEDYVKSSSYPLYPPFTQGLAIEGLRRVMESPDNPIDRANFESAKKIGSPNQPARVFSADGQFSIPSRSEFEGAQQVLNRANLRIQQEVPYDETKEAILTVSQMNKLIHEGIYDIKDFDVPGKGKLSGKELRDYKESIRIQIINRNLKELYKELNIDPASRNIHDKSRIYDRLTDEARKKGYTINELQSLIMRGDDGELKIPLMFNTAADKFESMLVSLVRDVVKVKVPGKSYIQGSSVGWTFKREGDIDKSKVTWVEGYDGSPLKTLHKDTDGNVKAGQVIVPFNFFSADGTKLKVDDFTKTENGKRMLDMEKVPKELLQLVGARIPNQGHNSMLPIEIVGFLPENSGDLIIVPAAITTQMGADFDVDKLFTYKRPYIHDAATNSFKVDKYDRALQENLYQDEVNPNGTTNPRDIDQDEMEALHIKKISNPQLQNEYFNTHWSVLTHPEMFDKVLRPLDKPDLKEENEKLMDKDVLQENYYHPLSQLNDFQSGKDAKTLVGFTSLSVTFNSVIQDKNLYLAHDEMVTDAVGNSVGLQQVRDYIKVAGEDGGVLELTNLSGNGKSEYDGQPRTKHDNHTTLQSAAVDNAKERALDNLNLTTETYKAAAAMVQLETERGEALNLKYVTRLLTQPIIKEFSALMKSGNDSLSKEFTADLKNTILQQLNIKYAREVSEEGFTKEQEDKLDNILLNPELMLKMPKMKGEDYGIHQLAALHLFSKLYDIGQRMSEIQSVFSTDVNGAGPNILASLDRAEKLDNIQQGPIANAEQIYGGDESITELGKTFSATVNTTNQALTQLLPYDKMKETFTELMKFSNRPSLTVDQQRNVIKGIRSFTFNSGQHWWDNAHNERVRLLYTKEGENSLARRVMDAQRTWGRDNYFLQRLEGRIGDTTSSPDFVEYQAATVGRIDEENNNRGWLEMLLSKDEEQRRLGEDLLRYAYLTGGVQDANSFVKFVPNAYISGTSFGDMLRETHDNLVDGKGTLDKPGFVPQYFQHNPEMALQIGRDTFGEYVHKDASYPEVFAVPEVDSPESQKYQHLMNNDGYLPFLSFRSTAEGKWILYARNEQGSTNYYIRVDTLGNEFTDEYNGNADTAQRSVFTNNRALSDYIPTADSEQQLKDYSNQIFGGYFKGRDKNVTNYDRLNIREGGKDAIELGLKTISNHPAVPEHLRLMSDILLKSNNDFNKQIRSLEKIIGNFNPEIKFVKEDAIAGRAHLKGLIELNPGAARNVANAADTFVHEMMHHRLQGIIALSGFDRWTNWQRNNTERTPDVQRDVDKIFEVFKRNNPQMVKHVEALDRIRYDALNAFKNQVGKERFAQLEERLKDKAKTFTHEDRIMYALHNVHELVAHIMTDSDVAKFLNEIKSERYQKMSFVEKMWEKLGDIIHAIAKAMGVKVKDDSLLREGIIHTLRLTDYEAARNVKFTEALEGYSKLRVSTENEANQLGNIGENSYNRKADITKDAMGYTIDISNEKPRDKKEPITQIDKIVSKLEKQKEDLYRRLNSPERTAKDRLIARTQLHELGEQIDELTRTKNLDLIAETANKQLKWIDTVLANEGASATDVLTAIDMANVWSGVINLLYGNLPEIYITDPKLANMQAEAQKKRIQLINRNARTVVVKAIDNKVVMGTPDFKQNLTELNDAEAKFITLSRVKPKLLQAIAVIGRQAANNRDEEINRVRERLESLNTRMKGAGITPNDFMQDDTWGLVTRLSGTWYKHIDDLRKTLDTTLRAVDRSEGLNDATRRARKSDAWNTYWNTIRRDGVFVDTRTFFDFKDGSKYKGAHIDAAFKELADKVGSEDYAKELLDKAHDKFNQYLEERTIYKDYLEQSTELEDHESAGKTKDEQDALLEKKRSEAYNKWLQYNSPTEFLNKMTGKGDVKYVNDGDKWIVMVPHASNTKFYDPKYQKIQGDPKKTKLYDEYKGLISEMIGYLPASERANISEDFFPIVSPDTVNTLAGMVGKIRNWDALLMNSLTATDAEEASRLKEDNIPINYTRDYEQARSRDLIRVAEAFSMMALHYKHMAPVLDKINVAESIVKEVNRQRTSGETEGKALRNALDSVKYFKDALLFQKPRELEGKIDNPIYSLNPAKHMKLAKEAKRLSVEREEVIKKIDAQMDEGNFDTPELDKQLEKINKSLTAIEKMARNFYGSKIVDTLVSINQMKALSYNPFSAVSNFTFGMISVFIHATGRVDMDGKTTNQAMGIMTHATKKYFTFGTAEDATAKKIQHLMERSGVMTELSSSGQQSNLKDYTSSHLKQAIKPYNWQKSGDYYAKGVMMVSMMLKKMVDVTDVTTGEKKKISLWEALDNEGKWDSKKWGENEGWFSEDLNKQKDWNNYRDRMRKVATIVFGNQDKNAPLMAKKNMLWRLAGQFRMSWFPEGIATRFANEREDIELGRSTKGRFLTYGTLGIFTSAAIMAKQALAMIPGIKVDAFKDVTDKKGNPIRDIDIENMRKNFAGMAWTAAFTASILMIRAATNDDDSKHKKHGSDRMANQLLINMLIRNHQDLMMYSSPSIFDTVTGNLLPATGVITDFWNAMKATGKYMVKDNSHDKHAFDKWLLKVTRAFPVTNLYNKSQYMLTRDLDAISK